MNNTVKPCPFCGKTPKILICDREGNVHDDDYENDPWSGLGYLIEHVAVFTDKIVCPVATHEYEIIGTSIYDSRDEAINAWNTRK